MKFLRKSTASTENGRKRVAMDDFLPELRKIDSVYKGYYLLIFSTCDRTDFGGTDGMGMVGNNIGLLGNEWNVKWAYDVLSGVRKLRRHWRAKGVKG